MIVRGGDMCRYSWVGGALRIMNNYDQLVGLSVPQSRQTSIEIFRSAGGRRLARLQPAMRANKGPQKKNTSLLVLRLPPAETSERCDRIKVFGMAS